MNDQKYLTIKRDFLAHLLDYFDDESHKKGDIAFFKTYYENLKIKENLPEFKLLLRLLLDISCYHHRRLDFFSKLDQIFSFLKSDIKETLDNTEIFLLFRDQNRILLFFLMEKIFTIDRIIIEKAIQLGYFKNLLYFWPEIKVILKEEQQRDPNSQFLRKMEKTLDDLSSSDYSDVEKEEEEEEEEAKEKEDFIERMENYILMEEPDFYNDLEEKRLEGENGSRLAYLIRKDLVEEFIILVNQCNISLSNYQIKRSFFETHSRLSYTVHLIEYAIFFGSIQIFNYLRMSDSKLYDYYFYYAIHSNSPEMISIMEEENFYHAKSNQKNKKEYDDCLNLLKTSIRCFHNDVAEYIKDNYFDDDVLNLYNIISEAIIKNNYAFFPNNFFKKEIMRLSCKYDNVNLFKILLTDEKFKEFIGNEIFFIILF